MTTSPATASLFCMKRRMTGYFCSERNALSESRPEVESRVAVSWAMGCYLPTGSGRCRAAGHRDAGIDEHVDEIDTHVDDHDRGSREHSQRQDHRVVATSDGVEGEQPQARPGE